MYPSLGGGSTNNNLLGVSFGVSGLSGYEQFDCSINFSIRTPVARSHAHTPHPPLNGALVATAKSLHAAQRRLGTCDARRRLAQRRTCALATSGIHGIHGLLHHVCDHVCRAAGALRADAMGLRSQGHAAAAETNHACWDAARAEGSCSPDARGRALDPAGDVSVAALRAAARYGAI